MAKYKNRVKKLVYVKASELVENPFNPRKHPEKQKAVLREVFDAVGIAGAVIVRELEDSRYELIDGHLRREELGDDKIPAIVVDLDEDEAKIVLATYDPLSSMAETDVEAHTALTSGFDVIGPNTCILFGELTGGKKLKKVPELDIDDNDNEGEDGLKDGSQGKELETSYIKMVQLYLSTSNIESFEDDALFVGENLGTATLTDTVIKALQILRKKYEAESSVEDSEESSEIEDFEGEEKPTKKKKKLSKV